MMKYIQSSDLFGNIIAPPSKSVIQRRMIADFLSKKFDYPLPDGMPDDVKTTYNTLKNIGNKNDIIYLNESGFSLRVIPILASLFSNENHFILSNSLANRPFHQFFSEIGLDCKIRIYDENNMILSVKGMIKSDIYNINCSSTSQILTGLLFVLPLMNEDSTIFVKDLKSKSYIDLTIEILKAYSIEVIHTNYEVFHIKGNQNYKNVDNYYEKDWSGTSFIIAGGVTSSINGVTISDLNFESIQADYDIMKILNKCSADYKIFDNSIHIKKSKIKAFSHNFSDCPDLVPAIIPIAIKSDDICELKGIENLKYKESNRISALISQYKKCNINISEKNGSLYVEPGNFVGNDINSHNDHRIVMSLSVSALSGEGVLKVDNGSCVTKSYPEFWNDLSKLNARIYE